MRNSTVIPSLNLTAQKSLFESIRNASIGVINDSWHISLISLSSGSGAFFLMQLFLIFAIIPITRGETINVKFER